MLGIKSIHTSKTDSWRLLLTKVPFNPSMDNLLQPLQSVDEIIHPFPNYSGNWNVIQRHTLLGMWLLIDVGIEGNPCW